MEFRAALAAQATTARMGIRPLRLGNNARWLNTPIYTGCKNISISLPIISNQPIDQPFMPTSFPALLRELTPPLLWRGVVGLRSRFAGATWSYGLPSPNHGDGLSGDYRTWAEAMSASTGYDSKRILDKTRISLLKVKNGEMAYERDSVLFQDVEYAWPVLAGLMWAAAREGGRLNVLDFGGSLGSTYFQNRAFLSMLPDVRWNIIEQPSHVETGKAWFADNRLHFYANILDCLVDTQPGIVLLSSVLQYLERPHTVLDQIFDLPCDHIIIDRTPFWTGPSDRLCVQTVPPSIYPASYPSWIFSEQRFFSYLPQEWQVIVKYDNADRLNAPVDLTYQGAIIARSTPVS